MRFGVYQHASIKARQCLVFIPFFFCYSFFFSSPPFLANQRRLVFADDTCVRTCAPGVKSVASCTT